MGIPESNHRQLDLLAAELRHNGTTVKLPEQPLLVLCELVEHPGEVIRAPVE